MENRMRSLHTKTPLISLTMQPDAWGNACTLHNIHTHGMLLCEIIHYSLINKLKKID